MSGTTGKDSPPFVVDLLARVCARRLIHVSDLPPVERQPREPPAVASRSTLLTVGD